MNKISALLIGALAVGFASCENYDMPNPPAQENPQEPAFDASSVVVKPAAASEINLEAVNNDGGLVTLAEIDPVEIPAGYALAFTAEVARDDSYAGAVEVPTVFDDSTRTISANPDDLNTAFRSTLSTLDPAAKALNIRYIAYMTKNGGKVRLGGENSYYGAMTATMKPFNPGFTVEEAYYLIGTPTGDVIDADKALKMSNSGASPYDDPNFSIVVDITADQAAEGYYFAVVPQSTLTAGKGVVFAPAESTEEASGSFVAATSVGMWAIIKEDNTHIIQFCARPDADGNHAYSQTLAIQNLYTPGNSNGWSQTASQMLFTNDYINYQGYVWLDGDFKFTSAPDWAHTNYGAGAAAGELSTDPGAGNLKADKGLYWASVNIVALAYSLSEPITTYGVIGDATPGGWDASTALTPSDDMLVWTGTVHLGAGEFKFRANNGWDINLGGDLANLTPGGDNIASPGEGDYAITLDLSTLPYSAYLEKK